MATLEIPLEEELEKLLADNSMPQRVEPPQLELLAFEPWRQGTDPEMAADAEWLFEILMA
ncbi:MAG TPA: hypothetical protein VLY24_17775 [Bryobacteraceae bacterium]|nr:hypothetical protein [Bryobacteraceae bacterium]